jgi:hypothetical protein
MKIELINKGITFYIFYKSETSRKFYINTYNEKGDSTSLKRCCGYSEEYNYNDKGDMLNYKNILYTFVNLKTKD